jgi:hypothetical protein
MGRTMRNRPEPIDFDALEKFTVDIREILRMAGKKAGKKDLLATIRKHTASYSGWRSPAIRTTVTHFIIKWSRKNCGVAFSEEELK